LLDDATKLVRFGARDFDADVGRFTTKDPVGSAGGTNFYTYAAGDPVNRSDPSGMCHDAAGNWRPCQLTWSAADKPNPNVDPGILAVVQQLANAIDADLQLSSGLRPGDDGNHGKGLAIDINAIDGVDIGDKGRVNSEALNLVQRLQEAALQMSDVRENFGPAGLWKATSRREGPQNFQDGSAKRCRLQYDHEDHVHISLQRR
jgi:RHS repeat-associated protein